MLSTPKLTSAAEEHRRDLLLQERVEFERLHALLDHMQVFHQAAVGLFAEHLEQRRVVGPLGLDVGLGGVVRRALEQVDVLVAQRVDAAEVLAAADRPGRRHDRDAEHLLDLVHQVERRLRWPVHLVDHGDDRDAAITADLEQLDGLWFDALGAVDQHQRGVGGDQRAVGVLGEVLVSRRVEQVDAVIAILELQRRTADRDAALLLEFHPVRGRALAALLGLDRTGLPNRAAIQQQLLGQRGLAGVRVRDDREGAAALNLVVEVGHSGGFWGGQGSGIAPDCEGQQGLPSDRCCPRPRTVGGGCGAGARLSRALFEPAPAVIAADVQMAEAAGEHDAGDGVGRVRRAEVAVAAVVALATDVLGG